MTEVNYYNTGVHTSEIIPKQNNSFYCDNIFSLAYTTQLLILLLMNADILWPEVLAELANILL